VLPVLRLKLRCLPISRVVEAGPALCLTYALLRADKLSDLSEIAAMNGDRFVNVTRNLPVKTTSPAKLTAGVVVGASLGCAYISRSRRDAVGSNFTILALQRTHH
jgi:hypothetical protein